MMTVVVASVNQDVGVSSPAAWLFEEERFFLRRRSIAHGAMVETVLSSFWGSGCCRAMVAQTLWIKRRDAGGAACSNCSHGGHEEP